MPRTKKPRRSLGRFPRLMVRMLYFFRYEVAESAKILANTIPRSFRWQHSDGRIHRYAFSRQAVNFHLHGFEKNGFIQRGGTRPKWVRILDKNKIGAALQKKIQGMHPTQYGKATPILEEFKSIWQPSPIANVNEVNY